MRIEAPGDVWVNLAGFRYTSPWLHYVVYQHDDLKVDGCNPALRSEELPLVSPDGSVLHLPWN